MPETKRCPRCGREVPADAHVCPSCGSRFSSSRRRTFTIVAIAAVVALAVVVAVLVSGDDTPGFSIVSESMSPALEPGDHVIVDTDAYGSGPPARGDIVVFCDPHGSGPCNEPEEVDYVYRVIGLAGETIEELPDGTITVDGKALDEPYVKARDERPGGLGPWHVPPGHVFVLGDNRPNANDSRFGQGFVPVERIVGKVVEIER